MPLNSIDIQTNEPVVTDKVVLKVAPKTEEAIIKVNNGDINQVNSQDLEAIKRAAEQKKRVEKFQRGY